MTQRPLPLEGDPVPFFPPLPPAGGVFRVRVLIFIHLLCAFLLYRLSLRVPASRASAAPTAPELPSVSVTWPEPRLPASPRPDALPALDVCGYHRGELPSL